MNRRPLALPTLAVTLFAIAGLSGCGETASSDAGSSEVTQVSTRSFEITTLATGELESKNKVEIRSQLETPSNIVEIVAEGTRVSEGDVLVRLNAEDILRELEEEELQYTEAQLNLEAATSEYEIQISDNLANLRKAELKVELAELALEQWEQGEMVKKIAELNTALEKADRDLARLEERIVKSEDLYERKFLSKDEFEREKIALLEARATQANARLDLDVYMEFQEKRDRKQKMSDLDEARQELVRVTKSNEINLKNKASRRENRAVQLGRREERLEKYRTMLEACVIKAPRPGLVVYGTSLQSQSWRTQSEGPLAVGRQVRQNDLLIVLPDTSEMVASVKVHESLAGRIRQGQKASIKIEAAGSQILDGVVDSVGVLAESGGWRDPNRREYTVKVTIMPREGVELKPSMRCEARITLGEVDEAISVPVQSVFSEGPVRFVYVENGGRYERRPISLGRRSDLYAEIRAGLEENEQVMLREPDSGMIADSEWNEAALIRAGYTIGEDGSPTMPRRGRSGGGRPAGRGA